MQQQQPLSAAAAARKQQRAALVSELSRTTGELSQLKKALKCAHVGTRQGRFLPVIEYAQLKLRVDSLKLKSRRLQDELHVLRAGNKAVVAPASSSPPADDPQFELAQQRLTELRERSKENR